MATNDGSDIGNVSCGANQESPQNSVDERANGVDEEIVFKVSDAGKEELEKHEWFHDAVPQDDVILMLAKEGDFLLRAGEFSQPIISCRHKGNIINVPIRSKEVNGALMYTIDDNKDFNGIIEAAIYHQTNGVPIYSTCILIHPVVKQAWELRSEDLNLTKKIGEGAFGEVYSGDLILKDRDVLEAKVPVAIKLVHGNKAAEKKEMLQKMHEEARFMRQYSHPNLVRLRGVLFSNEDTMIVMELVTGGSLDKYLEKNKDLTTKILCSFVYDVAAGLAYLHDHSCMHRDVAARNCLVSESIPIVKVSDFGLSRRGEKCVIGADERLPIKWQAPEVLQKLIYFKESDVWSYGVLVWEIFNGGKRPYLEVDNKYVRANVETIRLPDISEPTINTVMKRCWDNNYQNRPSMYSIEKELRKLCIHEITPIRMRMKVVKKQKKKGEKTGKTKRDSKGKAFFLFGHKGRKAASAEQVKSVANPVKKKALSAESKLSSPSEPPTAKPSKPNKRYSRISARKTPSKVSSVENTSEQLKLSAETVGPSPRAAKTAKPIPASPTRRKKSGTKKSKSRVSRLGKVSQQSPA